jgi:branched-chain amino acid transport system substrate-binding protein
LQVALGFAAASQAADPIKIGVSGPFTGGSAPMGVSMRDGVKLAVAEINAKGGVLGRQIQLVERDDEAKNERGVQIAQELINKEKVVATVGYINTGVALASQRFYQEAKIPVMNNVATGSIITKQFADQPENYIFRNSANDQIQSHMIVRKPSTSANSRRSPSWPTPPTTASWARRPGAGRERHESRRRREVQHQGRRHDGPAAEGQAGRRRSGADLRHRPRLAQIANGMEKLGWKVPLIGSWTLSMANFIDNAGKNGNGTRMPQTFIQDPNTPKRKAFIDAYVKAYNPPQGRMPSPVSAAQGYDSIYLLAAAIKQAGTTDGPKVKAALENLNEKVEGVVTTYNKPLARRPRSHHADITVFGEVKDGKVVRPSKAARATMARLVDASWPFFLWEKWKFCCNWCSAVSRWA